MAKKQRASTRTTLSLEAEKRKNFIVIPDDAVDSAKVPTIK
jgi:hypothetical protein